MSRGALKRERKAQRKAELALVPKVDVALLQAQAHAVAKVMQAVFGDTDGGECTVAAQLLAALIGPGARVVYGYAAWRVGPGDGDVIAHHPAMQTQVVPTLHAGQRAFTGHAWVELGEFTIDTLCWRWPQMLAQLDDADGRRSGIFPMLDGALAAIFRTVMLRPLQQVIQAHEHCAYYEEIAGMRERHPPPPLVPSMLTAARDVTLDPNTLVEVQR